MAVKLEDRISIPQFISRFVKAKRTMGNEMSCNCPFHDDKHASFSINIKTGLWKCHAPACRGAQGGNLLQFIALQKDFTDLRDAYKWICEDQGIEYQKREAPELSHEQVDNYHFALLGNQEVLKHLKEQYLWNDNTITKYKLGWTGDRISIPIYDGAGKLVNVRKKPLTSGACIGIEYFNQMRLYPIANLAAEEVYLMEGEKDCLLANQLGLNSMTVTSGAGSFRQEWILLFKDKRVYVCFDIDESGVKGGQRIKEFLLNVTAEFKIINLPIFDPVNADFTDYIKQFSINEFKALVKETKAEEKKVDRPVLISDHVQTATLAEAALAKYYFHRLQLDVVVSGKDTQPYLPPRQIEINCTLGQQHCKRCGMAALGGQYEMMLDHLSADILQWIDCSEDHHVMLIRRQMEIPAGCKMWKHKILQAQNVEEITLIPEIDYTHGDAEYCIRTAYSIGIPMKSNHSYRLEAITVPHPKTQYATHLIYAVSENKTAIDQFKITEKLHEKLKVFQIGG